MQDVFPVIPGDTDYRIFSKDYGNIPGLDIIFLLGGYFYHTSYDTIEKLLYALHVLFWYIFLYVISSLNTSSYTSKCLQTWEHPSTRGQFVQHN